MSQADFQTKRDWAQEGVGRKGWGRKGGGGGRIIKGTVKEK